MQTNWFQAKFAIYMWPNHPRSMESDLPTSNQWHMEYFTAQMDVILEWLDLRIGNCCWECIVTPHRLMGQKRCASYGTWQIHDLNRIWWVWNMVRKCLVSTGWETCQINWSCVGLDLPALMFRIIRDQNLWWYELKLVNISVSQLSSRLGSDLGLILGSLLTKKFIMRRTLGRMRVLIWYDCRQQFYPASYSPIVNDKPLLGFNQPSSVDVGYKSGCIVLNILQLVNVLLCTGVRSCRRILQLFGSLPCTRGAIHRCRKNLQRFVRHLTLGLSF